MGFSERQNGMHVYEMLKDLNPDIELRLIYSGRSAESYVSFISFYFPFYFTRF